MSVRQPVAVAGVSVPSHATLVVVGRPTIVVTGVQSSQQLQQFVVGVPPVARVLGRIRIVATATSLCIADMRPWTGARLLCGRCRWWEATDAPPMALSMGRFRPQTPHRSGWCPVGGVAVCREGVAYLS
jgi:hypothetical protein